MGDVLYSADIDGTTRTSSRMSVRANRVEIVTRSGRRRWSLEQKQEIVAESLGAGLTPTEVAHKHGISSGQLYTWRRELLSVQTTMIARSPPRFAEVVAQLPPGSPGATLGSAAAPEPLLPPAAARPEGLIELVLASGVIMRLDAHVDAGALRRVLDALDGRRASGALAAR
jgi:transposase